MLTPDISYQTTRPAEGFYTSEVLASKRWPVRTFLPTGYEPRYAYPLLVFFHGQGGDEQQILQLAPRLSRRNFICIGLRGPRVTDLRNDGRIGFSWGTCDSYDVLLEDYVLEAVEQTRETFNIHSERIYLAGVCEGASLAFRLGLTFPERFNGVISLNGTMPQHRRPLFRFPEVKNLRVFMGHGIANALMPLSLAKNDYKLLYSAGLDVDLKTYPTNHRLHIYMLRDINRWIIGHCNQAYTPTFVSR